MDLLQKLSHKKFETLRGSRPSEKEKHMQTAIVLAANKIISINIDLWERIENWGNEKRAFADKPTIK